MSTINNATQGNTLKPHEIPEPHMAISVAPVPSGFLSRVRSEGVDDLGQLVKHLEARGGEPCRDVLRRARPGERLILASFSPFSKAGPYREYGPVFILGQNSDEQVLRNRLPSVGSANDYLREQFVIRAYSEAEEIVDAALVQAPDIATRIERFFDSEDTAFLHVRFPTYGCFACRIDRV
jgi:Protein of unknown function (DUF1203)